MASYRFEVDIAAPRERVFGLWVDLDRAPEWVEGLARYTDVSGPPDQAGTTYVARFGSWSSSLSTVLEAERPRYIRIAFGSWLLRGENIARFEEVESGTRLTQEFRVRGVISRVMGRIFATGSYRGSFRGELETFKQLCEGGIQMIKEFRDFLLRGNVIDLAVAVVIGGAFAAVIGSFVNNILMPLLGIFGLPDMGELQIVLPSGAAITYGFFLNSLITFVAIVAAIFFLVVRPANAMQERRNRGEAVDPTTKVCTECASEIPLAAKRCPHCTQPQP